MKAKRTPKANKTKKTKNTPKPKYNSPKENASKSSTSTKRSSLSSKINNFSNKFNRAVEQGGKVIETVQNIASNVEDAYNKVGETIQNAKNFVNDIASDLKNLGLNPGNLLDSFQGESAEFLGRYQNLLKSEITGDRRLVKAVLLPKDSGGTTIKFMFNPTQLNFSRSVVIKDMEGAITSAGIPKVNFAHVNPWQLKLSQILFDTYEDEKSTSVLEVIQPLLTAVDYKKFNKTKVGTNQAKRPPIYYFIWGENNYLRCMVTDLTYNLTMFLPNGRPVRATVDISLKEVDDSPTTPLPSSQGGAQQGKSLVNSPNTEPVSDSSSKDNRGSNSPGSTGKDPKGQPPKGKDPKGQPRKGTAPKPKPAPRKGPAPKPKPARPKGGKRKK